MGATKIRPGQYFYRGYTIYSRFHAYGSFTTWQVFEGEHVHWLKPVEPIKDVPTKRDAMRIIDQWHDALERAKEAL